MRGNRSKPVIIGTVIALLIVLVFAIMSTASKASAPGKNTLLVGVNTPFPPFEIQNGGEVVGLDIDLMKEVAKALGRKLVIKDFNEFDALLPALENGTLGVVISAVTIREDRDEVVDFSEPYFEASQAVLKKGSNSLVYSGDPNVFTGVRVGYQKGTTSESWAENNLKEKVGVAALTPFGDMALGLELLQLGSMDVMILDEPAARSFVKMRGGLALAGTMETGEKYGIVVANGDPHKFLPTINKTIKRMKESGEYDKLVVRWFQGESK